MEKTITITSLKDPITITDPDTREGTFSVTIPALATKTFNCEWSRWHRISSLVENYKKIDQCTYTVTNVPATNAASAAHDTIRINGLRTDVSALQAYITTPYADYAARKADTDFNTRNLEKLYRQEDDSSIWRLDQITPNIKWSQVSGVRVTYENQTIYVNGASGNDTTGDGSITYPYKTLHCLDDFDNRVLKHTIKVIISAGTYTYFPATLNILHEKGGRLVLDGSGETWPVYAGPFTLDSVAGVGEVYPGCAALATDLVVTAAGWEVDEFFKKSINVLTGAQAGGVFQVFKNTTDTIRTSMDWFGFDAGDTIEIVTEPVVIETATTTTIKGSGPGAFLAPAFPFHEDNSLWMAGIRFVSDAGENPVEFIDLGAVITACSFVDEYAGLDRSAGLRLYHSSINMTYGDPSTFLNPLFGSDYYVHPFTSIANHPGAEDQWADIQANNSNVLYACCRRSVDVIGAEYRYFAEIMCSGVGVWGGTYSTLDFTYIEQIGFNQEAIIIYYGNVAIWAVHVEKAQRALKIGLAANVSADWLQANTVNITEDYAVVLLRNSNLVVQSSDVNAMGQIGALIFRPSGVTQATYPVSGGTSYTDSAGSWATAE